MSNEEKIKAFADMVDGIKQLNQPLEDENKRLHEQIDKINADRKHERKIRNIAFCISFIAIGLVFLAFILFAYLTPVEIHQGQDFDEHKQTQDYSEGASRDK